MAESWRSSIRTAFMFVVMVVGGVIAGLCLSAIEAVSGTRLRTGKQVSPATRAAAVKPASCPVCRSTSIERVAADTAGSYDHCRSCGWRARGERS